MWADTLMVAEQGHLLRLLVWSGASVLTGTAVIAWLRVRPSRSPLLLHFGAQTLGWGLVDAVIALLASTRIAPRDLASATRLDRFLWLNIGLDIGYVLVGVTIVVAGWRVGRRLGLIGAGMGVIVQGAALALLDLILAGKISR